MYAPHANTPDDNDLDPDEVTLRAWTRAARSFLRSGQTYKQLRRNLKTLGLTKWEVERVMERV